MTREEDAFYRKFCVGVHTSDQLPWRLLLSSVSCYPGNGDEPRPVVSGDFRSTPAKHVVELKGKEKGQGKGKGGKGKDKDHRGGGRGRGKGGKDRDTGKGRGW